MQGNCAALVGACLLTGCATGMAFDRSPSVMTTALLPGAAALLGLQQIGDAAAAPKRSFEDPITVKLRSGTGPADKTPAALPATATPTHCHALLDLQPLISGTAQPADWNVLQQRLADCQALRELAGVAPARYSHLPADWRIASGTGQWPASLWPAVSGEEAAALERPGQTLQTISQQSQWQPVTAATLPTMQLQAQGYALQIQWLAKGDFDGDGWQDWLLRWQARVVDGTWRESRCVLISRQAGEGPLRARPCQPTR